MNIPENPSIIYVAIVLFLIGLFLLISGLDIVKIEKITVARETRTWVIGLILMIFSVLLVILKIDDIATIKTSKPLIQDKKSSCQISILYPKTDQTVDSSTITVEGSSANCSKDRTYALILQDSDGDYYKQGEINFFTNGRWLSPIQFGSRWSGRLAIIKIGSYTDNIDWNSVSTLLPSAIVIYDQVKIKVK